ncbi:MAG: hypothetical protein ABIE55_02185 [Candidatus Aenigmatarchaeota archaeon]
MKKPTILKCIITGEEGLKFNPRGIGMQPRYLAKTQDGEKISIEKNEKISLETGQKIEIYRTPSNLGFSYTDYLKSGEELIHIIVETELIQ